MGKKLAVISVLLLFCLPFRSFALAFDGPLQVKNQFAPFVPVNQPYLEQAATESSFSFGLSHSSVYVMENAATWSADLDLELTELDLCFKKDIPDLFEVGLDVPVLRASQGFMDHPLAWYHRSFGFGDYGRTNRPNNSYLYEVDRNGKPVIKGENDRTGFGDARVTVKRKLSEGDPLISILADIELPTGNARVGYGNGSVDAALALLLDWNAAEDTRVYANLGVAFPGDLKAYQTVKLERFSYAGSGFETFVSPGVSLLAQLMVQTSPYPATGIRQIDGTGMLLVLGGRYYSSGGSWEFSLSEDPNTTGAPDFILNLTYKEKF